MAGVSFYAYHRSTGVKNMPTKAGYRLYIGIILLVAGAALLGISFIIN